MLATLYLSDPTGPTFSALAVEVDDQGRLIDRELAARLLVGGWGAGSSATWAWVVSVSGISGAADSDGAGGGSRGVGDCLCRFTPCPVSASLGVVATFPPAAPVPAPWASAPALVPAALPVRPRRSALS